MARQKKNAASPAGKTPRSAAARGPRAAHRARTATATATPKSASRAANGLERQVWYFGDGKADGDKSLRDRLGGKGANLAEMCKLGLPVPAGFTIETGVCTYYDGHAYQYPDGLADAVERALRKVERSMGKRFGDPADPLLVSVRSGARVSMPGMMDTVLNLGLNDTTVEGLGRAAGDPRFAWDAYRRFLQMFGDVVLGVRAPASSDADPFATRLEALKHERGKTEDTELDVDDLRRLVGEYKQVIHEHTGEPFPEDPRQQLWAAIGAVFNSWRNPRAVAYRELEGIPHDWGTAVSVVAMVFGNLGADSGTGVAFTRDPATGEKRFYGEFLMNAQGEDVVAGIRTPHAIDKLRSLAPPAWKELQRIQKLLEDHYRDMQDLEFTIERGKLWMLQCRNGKRTGFAAVRIACDLVREKKITKHEALERVDPESLNQLLQPVFDQRAIEAARGEGRVLTKGLNAGPGAATGRIAFRAEEAERRAKDGEDVILVRIETSPEDIRGMQAARGILTARGGMTSHAALVARQMGRVCVAGAGELEIDYTARKLVVGGRTFGVGDWLSIDGTTGEVIEGRVETSPSEVHAVLFGEDDSALRRSAPYRAFKQILGWADEVRTLGVRTNADQPDQCEVAIAYGAEGIGLCRTEHMFFGEGKTNLVREMILAENAAARETALAKLLPLQREDFLGIFRAMAGRPVTIRTLDPPLHEFLPRDEGQIFALASEMGVAPDALRAKIASLHEQNPMLGHRGCRLGITYPEITAMQARAIFEAAVDAKQETRKTPRPEVMIPLVGSMRELELQAGVVRDTAQAVFEERGCEVPYLVGTMIEVPRAALTAGEIARFAEFFSFGTNDLTQTTYGISRDDASRFIPAYVEHKIFDGDPFATLDVVGVGRLMRIAVDEGRAAAPGLKLGICGEHGGDPRSIMACQELGLDYVSCSPHRVPIARLAAAQAALRAARRPG